MLGESEAQTWDSLYNNQWQTSLKWLAPVVAGRGDLYFSNHKSWACYHTRAQHTNPRHLAESAATDPLTLYRTKPRPSPKIEVLCANIDQERGFTLSGRSGFPLLHALKNMHVCSIFKVAFQYRLGLLKINVGTQNKLSEHPHSPAHHTISRVFWNLPFSKLTS